MSSASQDQAIESARAQARDSQEGVRAQAKIGSKPSPLRLGIVEAVNGSTYTVGVLGANGVVASSIPGVPAWGSASFSAGDKVFLVWIGDRPIPVILASGASSGSLADGTPYISGIMMFFTE